MQAIQKSDFSTKTKQKTKTCCNSLVENNYCLCLMSGFNFFKNFISIVL